MPENNKSNDDAMLERVKVSIRLAFPRIDCLDPRHAHRRLTDATAEVFGKHGTSRDAREAMAKALRHDLGAPVLASSLASCFPAAWVEKRELRVVHVEHIAYWLCPRRSTHLARHVTQACNRGEIDRGVDFMPRFYWRPSGNDGAALLAQATFETAFANHRFGHERGFRLYSASPHRELAEGCLQHMDAILGSLSPAVGGGA